LTITNVGTADLTVTGVNITGTDYTPNAGNPAVPFVVSAGGGTTNISVDYLTPDVGSDIGNVTILSDDPDQPAVAVGLDGNGI
jgi:hypothetical protein